MALAAVTNSAILSAPGPDGAAAAITFDLGSLSTTASTDHVDTLGFAGRMYAVGVNGATNAAAFKLETSHDGTNWADITGATSGSIAADATGIVHVTPADGVARYVRVTVTTANANGTAFSFFMERH